MTAGAIAAAAIAVARMSLFMMTFKFASRRTLLGRFRRRTGFASRRSREHAFAGGERDVARVGHLRAVLRRRSTDGNLVANLQRVARPALADEDVRARELEIPLRDGSIRFLYVDIKTGVRIRPLD